MSSARRWRRCALSSRSRRSRSPCSAPAFCSSSSMCSTSDNRRRSRQRSQRTVKTALRSNQRRTAASKGTAPHHRRVPRSPAGNRLFSKERQVRRSDLFGLEVRRAVWARLRRPSPPLRLCVCGRTRCRASAAPTSTRTRRRRRSTRLRCLAAARVCATIEDLSRSFMDASRRASLALLESLLSLLLDKIEAQEPELRRY